MGQWRRQGNQACKPWGRLVGNTQTSGELSGDRTLASEMGTWTTRAQCRK